MGRRKLNLVATVVLSVMLVLPAIATAKSVEEQPSGFAMTGDLLVARPLGLVFLAIGSVVYVASLPIALVGGNAKDVARTLVVDPAREVFIRCLGCTRLGRKEKLAK